MSAETLAAIGLVLPWVVVGVGCWIGVQLIRQNGRILLRLEVLEQRLNQLNQPMAAQSPPRLPSLPLGSPAPDFELPLLFSDERVSLSSFRGRRVLLTFFSPGCGYCVQMAPELAALPLDDPLPVVITTGNLEENRRFFEEHQIKCPVLLQSGGEVAERYQATGTPMGYLIDAEGNIASPLAAGSEALLSLAHRPAPSHNGAAGDASSTPKRGLSTLRPLSESHILRTGLPAGAVAPAFTLPQVSGGELSLAEYRGRRVLLVFSAPDCGPCNTLAPRLEAANRESPEPAIIMVSRGDVEANRKKVAEFDLSFPVVMQRQWEISREYGIFATPVGFLIDERGMIVADVAQGPDQILALHARAKNPQPEEGLLAMS